MEADGLVYPELNWKPIFFRTLVIRDDFSGRDVEITGWSYEGYPGVFDSYVSALAAQSGYWEEYCEFHRCGHSDFTENGVCGDCGEIV